MALLRWDCIHNTGLKIRKLWFQLKLCNLAIWLETHPLLSESQSLNCKMRQLYYMISNFPDSYKRPSSCFTHWITHMVLENARDHLQGERRQAGWGIEGWMGDFLTTEKRRCYKLWWRGYPEKSLCIDLQSPGKQLKKFTACQRCAQTAKKDEEPIPRQEMQGRNKLNICFLCHLQENMPKVSVVLASYKLTIF